MTRNAICAECEHFKLRDAAGQPLPQAAHGIGRCHGYDGHVTPVEPFVRWNAPYCVLFGRAKDWQKREQWIAMRKRAEEDGANAAAA
jgi:hypothetical protein